MSRQQTLKLGNSRIRAVPGSVYFACETKRVFSNGIGLSVPEVAEKVPDRCATTKQRVEQLRLFSIDGVWEEPYTPPAHAGNDAAAKANSGEGRRT